MPHAAEWTTNERLARAESAIERVVDDPGWAREAAYRLLTAHVSDEAATVARRVLGLAAKELGDLAGAVRHLRAAVRFAERAGFARRAGEARMSLAVVLADLGRTEAALAEADRAAAVLTGQDAARLTAQRGLILQRLGRAEEALSCYRRALPALRRYRDTLWETRVLLHRGTLYAYQGAHQAAEADLTKCIELARQAGLDLLYSFALNNLGFAKLRRGDIPTALALCDESIRVQAKLGMPAVPPRCDRADALIAAGLGQEARETLTEVVAEFERDGFAIYAAEARLTLAQAALLDEDPAAAREAAQRAYAEFTRQRRHAWARLARKTEIAARWALGERSRALLRDAVRVADQLAAAGWPDDALQTRLLAGRVALELGLKPRARTLLAAAAAGRRRGPAQLRAAAWHAEALRRLLDADRAGASRALRAGLRVLEENAAILGATDLRAHSAVFGEELATLGLRLALEEGRAREVLRWSERWRAGALRQRPVRPPEDSRLAEDLAALRQVVSRIAEEGLAGHDTTRLRAERLRLERAICNRSRHARGPGGRAAELDLGALAEALGDRALVELLRLDERLHAVTMVDGRVRLFTLGEYAETLRETESLRFSLNRLARRHGGEPLLAAARLALRYAAGRLDEILFAPLRSTLGDRELVVVPTGALHALPWTVLPTCAGRPVAVAPSARTWLATVRGASRPGTAGVALVAGPGLEHAEPEVRDLAHRYREARLLAGQDATVQAVSTAIDGADLAHIAAHGHFRADNPLFSCLDLVDGPLTVYDMERLEQAPRRLVLSACDSALSAVRPGDELMGLASAVFALGTSTLVASVTPVPDDETRRLMTDLHDRLVGGTPPARALAEAQQAVGVDGFVCFGAG
ncbi:CHAT domain-containing protein [Carbonactinospora thermoautotrophica]|uniref:CHAT domain-containing protein n=1 Tax=Carbonactinospora thermoautotrophica TaxID=1469144 RepID=UPI0008348B3C|nr:CHAT domain-containing tetratricopeptide repeat protein [Carbonactinospora thermoautotrophica]